MQSEIIHLAKQGHIADTSVLVCGMARGADMTAYRLWTDIFDLPIIKMPANWDAYKKRAGYLRNAEMAAVADVLVAFWDGKSRGTRHMIETMNQMKKPVFVTMY